MGGAHPLPLPDPASELRTSLSPTGAPPPLFPGSVPEDTARKAEEQPKSLLPNRNFHNENYRNTHILTIEPDIYWSERMETCYPVDVEFDTDGNILVCSNTDEILKFNQQGHFLTRFSVGYGKRINGMSCNQSGDIYMTDNVEKEVMICDEEGHKKFKFSVDFSESTDQFLGGIVVSDNGMIFVANGDKVLRFAEDGTLLNTIPGFVCLKGRYITRALYVALDADGNVLVNDRSNHCVQVYKPDGQFVRSLRGCRHPRDTNNPDRVGVYHNPTGISVFENGHVAIGCMSGLYACENVSYGPIVRRFDDKDSVNAIFGTSGISTFGNIMAVVLHMDQVESTIELFRDQ